MSIEERDGELGDLTEPLKTERGEWDQDITDIQDPAPGKIPAGRTEQGIPQDIEREARVLQRDGTIGTIGIPASVTSVWDGRPINARDFMRVGFDSATATQDSPAETDPTARIAYTVPEGYVGVWKAFAFDPNFTLSFGDASAASEACNGSWETATLTTLTIDGVPIPDYNNLPLGDVVNFRQDNMPVWVLGWAGQTFQLEITYPAQLLIDIAVCTTGSKGIITQRGTLYGTNLLTRGLPKEFEIASQYFSGSVKR